MGLLTLHNLSVSQASLGYSVTRGNRPLYLKKFRESNQDTRRANEDDPCCAN